MVRQAHLIAVVGTFFLIGCAVLLVVGCAGTSSEAPQEKQGQAEITKQEQENSLEATASEEIRCEGTRTIEMLKGKGVVPDSSVQPGDPETIYVTNDIPGCPNKGGVLSGTDKLDRLAGEDSEDEVRGLGGSDQLYGGLGSDVLYGSTGNDELIGGGWNPSLDPSYTDRSKDVLYGGPGRDILDGAVADDVLYGGDGDDNIHLGLGGVGGGLVGGPGKDVIHGGDGNDFLNGRSGPLADHQRDELDCGPGTDEYLAHKNDFVDSSCEVKWHP